MRIDALVEEALNGFLVLFLDPPIIIIIEATTMTTKTETKKNGQMTSIKQNKASICSCRILPPLVVWPNWTKLKRQRQRYIKSLSGKIFAFHLYISPSFVFKSNQAKAKLWRKSRSFPFYFASSLSFNTLLFYILQIEKVVFIVDALLLVLVACHFVIK